MHCHWLMTSFPVRTTAHVHMRRVLWSVLSHIHLPASTSDSVGQSRQLWWVSEFFVSARCDNWAKNHFTVLYYHVACCSCPKNRMWSHVHCCMQQKKNNPMMQLSFPFNWLAVFELLLSLFSWHSVDSQTAERFQTQIIQSLWWFGCTSAEDWSGSKDGPWWLTSDPTN